MKKTIGHFCSLDLIHQSHSIKNQQWKKFLKQSDHVNAIIFSIKLLREKLGKLNIYPKK